MSKSPAYKRPRVMISSGALPKVRVQAPPIVSPTRTAICSVPLTIMPAIGRIASAAKRDKGHGYHQHAQEAVTGNEDKEPVHGGFHGEDAFTALSHDGKSR